MNAKSLSDDFPEVQSAIYGVALCLDSVLLNGIPYGVVIGFRGFLQKTAATLFAALADCKQQVQQVASVSGETAITDLGELKQKCHEFVDFLTSLESFKSMPLEQVRSTVARISPLRDECVQLIQQLEACLQTPKPFYQTRPNHSSQGVSGFLDNLDRLFTDAWASESKKVNEPRERQVVG